MLDFLSEWNEKSGRIIVFAGVFDPVHNGHIAIAQQAELHHGTEVVFLPERIPQHKHGSVSYEHRLKMLEIATADESDLSVVNYPKKHHYIEEVFTWLSRQFPNRTFAWLVGSDVVDSLVTWPDIHKLRELHVNLIIIASRTKIPLSTEIGQDIAGVPTVYLQSDYTYLNSSYIRADIENRKADIPPAVYEYIQKHKLYSS